MTVLGAARGHPAAGAGAAEPPPAASPESWRFAEPVAERRPPEA